MLIQLLTFLGKNKDSSKIAKKVVTQLLLQDSQP